MGDFQSQEMDRLFARSLDELLDADESTRLEQLLGDNATAREKYVSLAILNSYLEQEHQSLELQYEIRQMLDESTARSDVDVREAHAADRPYEMPAARKAIDRVFRAVNWRYHPARFAAAVALLTFFGWLSFYLFVRPRVDREPGQIASDGVVESERSAARTVGLWDCQFHEPRDGLKQSDVLREGQRVLLAEGILQLQFDDGAEVTLEGPTQITVSDASSARLHRGKMLAYVDERAVGFSVRTPQTDIIDLGTQFALVVEQGTTETHVFEGKVELNSGGNRVVVQAGSAARIDEGNLKIDPADPAKFTRLLHPGRTQEKDVRQQPMQPPADDKSSSAIAWGQPRELTGASDILSEGRHVAAVNCGRHECKVNGVSFAAGRPLMGNGETPLSPGTTGDTGLDAIVSTYGYGNTPYAMEIKGLTTGHRYKIQLLLADPRNDRKGHRMVYGDGSAEENVVTLRNRGFTSKTPPFGQFVVGTFTAKGPTQKLTIRRTDGKTAVFLSAYVVREVR
jgi:hypothetical protein